MIESLALMYQVEGDYLGTLLSVDGDPHFVAKMKSAVTPALVKRFGLRADDARTDYICEFGMSAIIGMLTYWYNQGMSLPGGRGGRNASLLVGGGGNSSAHEIWKVAVRGMGYIILPRPARPGLRATNRWRLSPKAAFWSERVCR